MSGNRTSDATKAEIVRLWQAGKTQTEIAREVGTSQATVSKVLEANRLRNARRRILGEVSNG